MKVNKYFRLFSFAISFVGALGQSCSTYVDESSVLNRDQLLRKEKILATKIKAHNRSGKRHLIEKDKKDYNKFRSEAGQRFRQSIYGSAIDEVFQTNVTRLEENKKRCRDLKKLRKNISRAPSSRIREIWEVDYNKSLSESRELKHIECVDSEDETYMPNIDLILAGWRVPRSIHSEMGLFVEEARKAMMSLPEFFSQSAPEIIENYKFIHNSLSSLKEYIERSLDTRQRHPRFEKCPIKSCCGGDDRRFKLPRILNHILKMLRPTTSRFTDSRGMNFDFFECEKKDYQSLQIEHLVDRLNQHLRFRAITDNDRRTIELGRDLLLDIINKSPNGRIRFKNFYEDRVSSFLNEKEEACNNPMGDDLENIDAEVEEDPNNIFEQAFEDGDLVAVYNELYDT